MKSWSFHFPVTIHGGPEACRHLHSYVEGLTVLLVTSEGTIKRGVADRLMQSCPSARWLTMTTGPNPDMHALDRDAPGFLSKGVQAVVGLGGGSAMDSAKAMAAILVEKPSWSLTRFLKEQHEPLQKALSLFCVPTTAGTGAEVTPFGTMWDMSGLKKYSLASPLLYPKAVFLEPGLTRSLSKTETVYGGLDTLSHALETLWGTRATPASLALARGALLLALENLPKVLENGSLIDNRARMQEASLLAGMALCQSRTSVAHVMSYPLTLHFGIPHGLACSFALPALISLTSGKNAWAGQEDGPLAEKALSLMHRLGMPGLISQYCRPEDAFTLLQESFQPEWGAHFVPGVSKEEFADVLRRSLWE